MRSRIISLVGCALLALLVAGCRKPAKPLTATVPADFVTHSGNGFTPKAPKNWKSKPAQSQPIVFAMLADDAITNLNVGMVAEAMNDRNPDHIGKQVAAGMSTQVQNFNLKSTESILVAGEDSPRLVYEGSTMGMKFRGQQTYVSKGSKTFIVTFTAQVDSFDKYAPIFDQILASMTIP